MLRELLHIHVAWNWEQRHTDAFENLKKEITNPPVLAYFDAKKPVTLTCDASKFGLCASCLQENKPIAYASRALTDNETRWAQIEKEMASIVFGCTKFHHLIMVKLSQLKPTINHLKVFSKKPISKSPSSSTKHASQTTEI